MTLPPPSPSPKPKQRRCTLYDCVCCWRDVCSPRIPRVAPGMDYVCIPAAADDRPDALGPSSVLVGFLADIGLRLHRFRVSPSGRILGRSDDALEILCDVNGGDIIGASAALSPDRRSLFLFCKQNQRGYEIFVPPRALQLQLLPDIDDDETKTKTSTTPLPPPPLGPFMTCRVVSAAGKIWAPYVHLHLADRTCRIVMQRLDKDKDAWVEAGTIVIPYKMNELMEWGGGTFQGCAVVGDAILVSLQPSHLFFSFDCITCAWTAIAADETITSTVPTTSNTTSSKYTAIGTTTTPTNMYAYATISHMYVPIRGRGVYVQEDDAIYFLHNTTVFAYKLLRRGGGPEQVTVLEMKRPAMIDSVCPFEDDGFGLLTHLGGRLMCSVWISTELCCSCDNFHVLISTFRVKYRGGVPQGIEILHSTCRRLDMLPSKPIITTHEFCFLQEYEEEYNQDTTIVPFMLLEGIEEPTSSPYAMESSKMLACCREFSCEPPLRRCYVLEEPAIQINKAVYIVCQVDSRLIVYLTNIVNGRLPCHDSPLMPIHDRRYHVMKQIHPSIWPFICSSSSNMYAVAHIQDDIYEVDEIDLRRGHHSSLLKDSRHTGVRFAMVLQVGHNIIAVSHTLQVFCYSPSISRWKWYRTSGPDLVLNREVNLSGYVVLSANTFLVSDNETCRCFLFDLRVGKWKDVLPVVTRKSLQVLKDPLPIAAYGRRLLNGRCLYVEGFIYSCTTGGLVACDIDHLNHPCYLSDRIHLDFPCDKVWEIGRLCFDYVGTDRVSGAIMFCVVQGEFCDPSRRQDVFMTIVQVKTEKIPGGKMKPVSIEHVDAATCFVPGRDGWQCTSSCFAVGLDS